LLGPSAGRAGGENAIREPKTRLRDENQTKQKRFDMRRGTIAANYQGEVKGVLTLRFPGEAKSDLPRFRGHRIKRLGALPFRG
jgi:hypothetical protein